MTSQAVLSPADILTEIVGPDRPILTAAVSHEFLGLRFNEQATSRIRDLLQKNNAGTITPPEKLTLENYLLVGELLDLLQAEARHTIRRSNIAGP